MNNPRQWTAKFLFAMRVLILIKIVLIATPVFGQGRLSGIRNEVRRTESKPPTKKEAKPRKRPTSSEANHRDDDHNDDRDDHRHDTGRRNSHRHDHHRGNRHHRSRRPRPRVSFFSCPTPPQVIHTREIHLIEPAPVLVPTMPVDPMHTPLVVPQAPMGEVTLDAQPYQSVVEPIHVAEVESAIGDEVFVSEFANWGARVTAWYGGGVDDISQGNLSFLFQSPGSLGLDGNVRTVREKGFSDHLWLGDLNVVYEPVLTDDFRFRIGAGFNWLADSWGSDFGFNLTAGFDSQLSERWILGGEVDLGNLGSSDYLHAQLSLAYQLQRAELVVGFDHTNIGSIDLNSPFAGVRFRF